MTVHHIKKCQRGASMTEYALALALLAIAFVWAGRALQRSSEERGNMSMNAARDMVPCDPSLPLSGVDPDVCK